MSATSTLWAGLLGFAQALPGPWYAPGREPETPGARCTRVETVATGVHLETEEVPLGWPFSRSDLAAMTLHVVWEESGRFDHAVHRGTRTGDGGRARCLGQLHRSAWVSREEWLGSTGTDPESTRLCVRLVVRVLVRHAARCRLHGELGEWSAGALWAAYGTGSSCNPRHRSPHHGEDWALRRGRVSARWAARFATFGVDP